MRQKLLWVGMAWRLLIALILALCLVPVGSSPVAALSAEDLFQITYEVSLSKTAIQGNEVFYATIQGEARCKEDLEFPYSLVSKAEITSHIVAIHNSIEKSLSDSYTVTIEPIPQKKDDIFEIEEMVIPLQFPAQSESGNYDVFGKLDKAIAYPFGVDVTDYLHLPQTQFIDSVTYTYVAPDGGGGGGDGGGGDGGGGDGGGGGGSSSGSTVEEVKTNLFGTEASFSISSSGEILETIEATSEDGTLTLTIPEGTIALDKDDNPLTSLEAEVDTSPLPPPENTSIIGLAYDFGPDGATFDPPITLTQSYDPNDIPEGVAEEDLVLAWYDEAANRWVELDCVVYTGNNTITASIEHFTTFAIIAIPAKLPPPPGVVLSLPPAAFTPSSLRLSPVEVNIGDEVTISLFVVNTGGKSGSYEVTLKIDGVVAATKEVTVSAGFSKEVTFTISKDIAGTYSVDVNGLTDSFTVKEKEAVATPEPEPESASTPTPPATYTPPPVTPINWPVVCGVVTAVVAMGSLLFFLARRRHTKSSS